MKTKILLLAAVDADALAWKRAVTANGGSVSSATVAAVSRFVRAAKRNNYWNKLLRVNLFCGDNLSAALVPLKAGAGGATDTNANFLAADYTEASGLTGDGATKYLATGFLGTSLTLDSTHMALYSRATELGGRCDIGASLTYYMNGPYTDGRSYQQMGTALTTGVLTPPFGHLIASRTASNAHSAYQGGVAVGFNDAASSALPGTEFFVMAINNGGTAEGFSTMPCGGYSIGLGLTAADASLYSADMQAFQQALGRNV